MTHIPVLLHEVIDGLALKPGDIFVDGTLGGGGHSEEVLKRFGNRVKIIGIDLDSDAVRRSEERLGQSQGDIKFIEGSFRNLNAILDSLNIKGVDKILLDLGLSSNQFEESGRGFSFQKNEPLIMSFKKDLKEADLTAKEILNTWDLENIITIINGPAG